MQLWVEGAMLASRPLGLRLPLPRAVVSGSRHPPPKGAGGGPDQEGPWGGRALLTKNP